MSPHRMRQQILEGDVVRTLLKLSTPLIFTQLVQILYNLVDTFWLGRLGRAAVSAPAVAWPIVFTVTMFGGGFATAGLALVSQYVGANKWERVDKVVGNLLVLLGALSIVFGVLGYVFTPQILHLLRIPEDVIPEAATYLRIIFASLPFSFVVFVFSMVLRAVGDMWTPTKINLATITLNAILDPVLIFGWLGAPAMGVAGAAIATALSNAVASMVSLVILFKGWKHIHVRLEHLIPDGSLISKIVSIGTPAGLSNSLNGLAFTTIMAIVSAFGSVAVAAYGIGMRIINIVSAVAFGMSQAASVMIGQNIGAEQYERAKHILATTIKITFSTMSVLALVVFALRYDLIEIFISDPAVIQTGAMLLFYFSLSVPFFGIFFPVMNALRAAGKTKISATLAFVRLWVFRVGLAYLLGRAWGSVNGVFLGMALSNVLGGLLSLYFVFWTGWMKKIID